MQEHSSTVRLVAATGAVVALGLVAGLTGAGVAVAGDSSFPPELTTVPGDTPLGFWPYETGALVGASETFTDLRADGSYYDPSLGRRIFLVDSASRRR